MAARHRNAIKGISKGVFYILAILLILLVLGFIAFFTNGFTSDFKTFYVVCREETIMNNTAGYEMQIESEYHFDVRYTFDFLNRGEKRGYDVGIMFNYTDENDFDFYVDEQLYSFSGEKLTMGFDINMQEDYFTIKSTMDLPEMIQANYPNKTVTGVPKAIDSGKDYFLLIVKSEDGTTSLRITFRLETLKVMFEKDNVVF